jgi:hypothetical protein
LAIARKKNVDSVSAAPAHDTADEGDITPRKRAFSVACSNSMPASGSPHPIVRQGRVGGTNSSDIGAANESGGGAVPFLNLRKMATRDDSRYHTLHGGELFTPTDASPEEKLHRVRSCALAWCYAGMCELMAFWCVTRDASAVAGFAGP